MRDIIFARSQYAKLADRRLLLTIELEPDGKYVYKQAASPEAGEYLLQILDNERKVQAYIGERAGVLMGTLTEDGRLRYPFVELPTIQYLVCEYLDQGAIEQAWRIIDQAVAWIHRLDTQEAEVCAQPQLVGLYGDALRMFSGPVRCLKLGLLDINAENILYDQETNRYLLIDHEMVIPGPLPVDITVFRFVFFTLIRLAALLDLHADHVPTRPVGNGLFRIPATWDLGRWIDEQRINAFIALEERLQSAYTGLVVPWPRPLLGEGIVKPRRQRRNVADRLAQLHVDAEQLCQTRAEVRRARRRRSADAQRDQQTILRLEQELHALRQALPPAGPLSALQRARRYAALARRKLQQPLPKIKRRIKRLLVWSIDRTRTTRRKFAYAFSSRSTRRHEDHEDFVTTSISPLRGLRTFVLLVGKIAGLFTRNWTSRPAPGPAGEIADAAPTIVLSAVAGAPWQGPLFSIILPCLLPAHPQREAIIQSLRRQTYQSFELVLWDAETGTAWTLDAPDQPWKVARPGELGPTLLGKYACVASAAFAALPATFLEVNAIALESQELDITINSLDDSDRAPAMDELYNYRGDSTPRCGPVSETPHEGVLTPRKTDGAPIETRLMVGQAEALGEELTFCLDRITQRAHPAHVAGRLLSHSPASAFAREYGALPASSRWETTTLGNHLLVRLAGQAGWGQVPQTLHPVDSVVRATAAVGDKPRLLVVFPFIAVGGAEKLTLDVLTRLKQRFDLLVVALEPHDPTVGSMVAEFQELTPYVYLLPEFLPPQLTFSALCYLIDGYRVQTLFVANGAGWIYDAAASLRDRFPCLHMVNQVYDHRIGWIDRYNSALARVFDRHIAPNQAIVGAYRERGVPPAKIDLIYHGTDLAAFDPSAYDEERIAELRSRFGLPQDRPIVAFLARMHPQKRPLDFIMLARRFQPADACFLMVGDGPLMAQLDQQLARAQLAHLYRLPFYKPFRDVLAVADVVVIPSEYEGLPLVLLNAQALGKPVVATDVGAIREVLEYTGGGLVVARVGDLDALERGIRAMLARPPDAARMRERIRERFDIEQVAARYGDALGTLDF